jgi:hypothetical protein
MTTSTIERAFQIARSGQVRDVATLKLKLEEDGCRAVEALLAPRSLRRHLEAICVAAFKPTQIEASADNRKHK